MGDLGNFVSGIMKGAAEQAGFPPCKDFSTTDDRFKAENCNAGLGKSCMKQVTSDGKVSRMCTPVAMPDTCQENDEGTVACACTTDYCNGAGRDAPALPLLLMLPAAAAALLTGRL